MDEAAAVSAQGIRPTMKDVAARAGVGIKTVSRVVNGEPGVLPSTAFLVHRAIAELGFRRNESARQLRTGRTAGIGLIMEDVADPFYSLLAAAVERIAHQHGNLLFTASSQDDPAKEAELALALCARRVDGLIIVPAADDHRYLEPELHAGLPMVFADRPPINLNTDTVLTDNADGTRQGVTHLLNHGHTRIGYLGDSARIYTSTQRLHGYTTAMADAHLPTHPHWIHRGPPTPERIHTLLNHLLDPTTDHPVTALFTANNRTTVTVLRDLATRTTPPPALVGFDDFELADLLHPAITVVAQNPTGLGHTAANLLFTRLAGDTTPPHHITLPTHLIPRGSGETPPR
jgi:LacI family transcriptional regulator